MPTTPVTAGSGLDGSFGVGIESVEADPTATPDHWFEYLDANLASKKNVYTSKGMRNGRLVAAENRRVVTTRNVAGDFDLEVPSRGFGILLRALLGSSPAPLAITANGETKANSYAFDLATVQPTLVVQQNIPSTSGVIVPMTYRGVTVQSATFSMGSDGVLQAKFTCIGKRVDTDAPQEIAVYTTADSAHLFPFAGGHILADGTEMGEVTSFELTVNRNVDNSRYFLGGGGDPAAAIAKDLVALSGKVSMQFHDLTWFDKWYSDESVALQVSFTGEAVNGSTAAPATLEQITFDLAAIKFDDDASPALKGADVITTDLSFSGMAPAGSNGLLITYVTADSAL